MQKLKIATMSTAQFPVPIPENRIMAPGKIAIDVADGLASLGHEVYFFATKDSKAKNYNFKLIKSDFNSTLKSVSAKKGWKKLKIARFFDQELLSFLYEKDKDLNFDLIILHDPFFRMLFPIVKIFTETPVLMVVHCGLRDTYQRKMHKYYKLDHVNIVPISNSEKQECPDLNWTKVVHNGVDINEYPFDNQKDDYLLFAGRICKDKGVKEAIEVAEETNHKLLIAGEITDNNYYLQQVKPKLSKKIEYLGLLNSEELKKYYKKAKALLIPIQWREPFGLTYIEAMACGTPVVTFNKGAASEVVKDRITGFVVEDKKRMKEAVNKISKIKPSACRRRVEKYFSKKKMIKSYEKVCYKVIK